MHITAFERMLKPGKKDWEMAMIFVRGRTPIGIDTDTDFRLISERVISIKSDSAIDPFYDRQRDGVQPKICTQETLIDLEDIVTVDYIEYPKIFSKKTPAIITSIGEA